MACFIANPLLVEVVASIVHPSHPHRRVLLRRLFFEWINLQALIARVAREVEEQSGVDLEQLINPGKVHSTAGALEWRYVPKKPTNDQTTCCNQP